MNTTRFLLHRPIVTRLVRAILYESKPSGLLLEMVLTIPHRIEERCKEICYMRAVTVDYLASDMIGQHNCEDMRSTLKIHTLCDGYDYFASNNSLGALCSYPLLMW